MGFKDIMLLNDDSIFFKLYKFHAFWQGRFDRNTRLTVTNSNCGGLLIGLIKILNKIFIKKLVVLAQRCSI